MEKGSETQAREGAQQNPEAGQQNKGQSGKSGNDPRANDRGRMPMGSEGSELENDELDLEDEDQSREK